MTFWAEHEKEVSVEGRKADGGHRTQDTGYRIQDGRRLGWLEAR